jgi:hypothetical protein
MDFKIRGRFSDEKKDQIEQLVSYATMLGLTGRDLVSIGGKMDRIRVQEECKRNLALVKSVEIHKIGNDRDMEQRFKIKTPNGNYNFEFNGYSQFRITSLKTKHSIIYTASGDIEFPRSYSWYKRYHCAMLHDIATGKCVLNF